MYNFTSACVQTYKFYTYVVYIKQHSLIPGLKCERCFLGCDWVGTPVSFQRCLVFIFATANKEFTLTAGKFVPVCNSTMMNVRNELFIIF